MKEDETIGYFSIETPGLRYDYDESNPPYERIIESANVDINNIVVKHRCSDGKSSVSQMNFSKCSDKELLYNVANDKLELNDGRDLLEEHELQSDRVDYNFYKRSILVTSQGIQIMKLLPDCHECDKCLDDAFCPRGPVQDFCIDYN